jgi:hypothetical protein
MLEHCKCQGVYVIVDALDECQEDGMADLLNVLSEQDSIILPKSSGY